MKRLLIYLGLLTTLLAMPYHAKADNTWAYYLYGEINGWNQTDAKTNDYFFGKFVFWLHFLLCGPERGVDFLGPVWVKIFIQ